MKKFILDKCMNIIKNNKNYNDTKLAEIKYGLEGLYLMVTKLIVITIIAIILKITKEYLIFMLIYTIMRTPSFGIHAKKSWICLLTSTMSFIGFPLLAIYTKIDIIPRTIIGIISITGILLFSPADTHKRPIINKKRRMIYKTLSTIIATTYIILSITIKDQFISNSFFYATILQNILISPITYKIFKMPYNNYKTYIKTHGLN